MKKNKIFGLLGAAFIAIPLAISCNKQDKTCSIIKNNYKSYVYFATNTDEYEPKSVARIKSELEEHSVQGITTYKFKDIDYDECKTRSSWAAAGHLSRALKIAIIAEDRDSNELRDIAKKLTLHWVLSNYHNINWWQNELGANNTLANIGLFTFDYLGKKGQDAFNGKIRESSLKWRPSVSTHTGANVFDYIDITCRNAAINNDKEEMTIAVNRLAEEITNKNVEGFQTDGSFFQHGRQVQNVSYGKAVIRVGRTLYNLRGTDYKIADDKMKIISDYILKGLRFSTFKGYTNYNTVSREYSRPNNLDTQANGFNELNFYEAISNYPEEDKEPTYELVDSFKKRKNAITKDTVQYFNKAKMIVCNIGHKDNKDGIYISYKATEPNLTNTECVNGENQLGLNLSYGTNTCVMDYGNEYFNIAPYMDYNYMPGTSSPYYGPDTGQGYRSGDEKIKEFANTVYGDPLYESRVPTKYTDDSGEVICIYNDGQLEFTENKDTVTYSMTKTRHHERGKYTVTCFATTDGMALVGSDLSYTPKDNDPEGVFTNAYHTTVDQYLTSDKEGTKDDAQSYINHEDKVKEVVPGNVMYTSLVAGQNLSKKVETRVAIPDDWKRNNRDYKPNENTPVGAQNVATIQIDTSGTNNSYAYAIEPVGDNSNFVCLAHDSGVHAIKTKDKIMAAFYKKDATFTDGVTTYQLDETEKAQFDEHPDKGFFKLF